jgi:hypothetical protein
MSPTRCPPAPGRLGPGSSSRVHSPEKSGLVCVVALTAKITIAEMLKIFAARFNMESPSSQSKYSTLLQLTYR